MNARKPFERVLIVGGGVAGLTLACGIAAQGVRVLVVESKNEISGSGIGFWGYGIRAFDFIGMRDKIIEVGSIIDHVKMYDEAGVLDYEYDNPGIPGADYPPEVVIGRPNLAKRLTEEAIARGAEIRYGTTMAEYEETDDDARVVLSDGTEGVWDLVVGSDGAFSTLRSRMLGIETQPEITGTGVWRALVPMTELCSVPQVWYSDEHRIFMYPSGMGEVYAGISEWTLQPKRNEEESRAHVLELLEKFTAPAVMELRERVESGATVMTYRPLNWLLLKEPWYKGRFLLIGDAAHAAAPHLSSGGGMAVEDAGVLSEMIAEQRPVDETLQAFFERRLPRVSQVFHDSREVHDRQVEPRMWNAAADIVNIALEKLAKMP